MKEIGRELREKREENGVSIEEVAEDLKMRPSQISNLEEGNKDGFPDVNTLKNYIRDYSKYLGLDSEKLTDEFNEFLFDFTSKIPASDIEKAKEEREKEKKEFASPYTKKEKNNNKYKKVIYIVVGIVILFIIGYFVLSNIKGNDFNDNNVTYVIRR